MVEWPLVLAGLMGIGPALGILFLSYGPYDGHFKDNVLFLFFMGGIFAGMVLIFFEILLRLPRDPLYTPAMVLVGIPLMEQLLKLIVLNRKPHQRERETIFYGGSFGLGFATMTVLFLAREISLARYQDLGLLLSDPWRAVAFLIVGTSVMLAHFGTGLILGDAVRRQDLPKPLLLAVGAFVPLQFLVFEYTTGLQLGREFEGLIYLPVMLLYGVAIAWWAHAKLLPLALAPDAQRKRRRLQRKAQREGAGGER